MSQLQNWLIKNHEPESDKSSPILSKIPSNLVGLIGVADKKTFVSTDVLAITSLSVLAPLCSGIKLFRNLDDIDGDRVVVYVASFFRSGGGKTSAVNLLKDAFLGWLDEYYATKYHASEKLKEELEKELEVCKDTQQKRLLIKKLNILKSGVDVFIPNATEAGLKESLKNGSTPLITLDNLGKMIGIAKRNEHVGQLLKMVDEIFDSANFSTNRTLSQGRTQNIKIGGLGLYAASTLGNSGLSSKMIYEGLEDGLLNRFLIVFQQEIEKNIPFEKYLSKEELKEFVIFAKKFYVYASKHNLLLSEEAKLEAIKFNAKISKEFRTKYSIGDETSGFSSRSITMLYRIAIIFHITEKCETESFENIEALLDKTVSFDREMILLSKETMLSAIDFFDYVKKEHTFKILDVANQNSRKSASQKVLESIQRLCEKNKHCTVREITQSSRIAQKDGLLQILDDLLLIEKIKKEGEFYTV
ncbi:DUF3987 domain-containing protein [Sulfurimonas xiamenensis]|uniref:DUF3987 domain-containing protein n=1 Tax=Sulfurimonas xiamenensis TaxID=2590021 RepID=A0AAJ4DM98_9BACT|nr:DUF3987 domain-containing protein [Sulfurimonas xiamenensis]QFR42831.1 DUF3987 domain-containing protein [Sulfurimonas xiamenensis]